MHCVHCEIEITDHPHYVKSDPYCCKRCYLAAEKLRATLVTREKQYLDLIDALVRALDSRERETANNTLLTLPRHRLRQYQSHRKEQ